MDNTAKLERLYQMRFLESEGDTIEEFEQLLNDLSIQGTIADIPKLCCIFEDEISEASAGDTMVETLLYILLNHHTPKGFEIFADNIPCMLPKAEFWTEQIHKRVLESTELTTLYEQALINIQAPICQRIITLLLDIQKEQPELYAEQTTRLLSAAKV
ncbi:Imm30 family immunity protein [Paenibacillus kandeliae]|uniref:Imm30 family immunity protein n=1 Tax=Paenibacillus kandeliae TaxID=3231269 RepID=UPI00345871D8